MIIDLPEIMFSGVVLHEDGKLYIRADNVISWMRTCASEFSIYKELPIEVVQAIEGMADAIDRSVKTSLQK